MRDLAGHAIAVAVTALVLLFIAVPLGAVLLESFHVAGPLPLEGLKRITVEAIALIPEEERDEAVQRWVDSADDRQWMDGVAAALELIGEEVPWNRAANYDDQIAAARDAVSALPPDRRAAFDAELPIAVIMLHKRIPLAFAVRDRLDEDQFATLRTGAEERLALDHYRAFLEEPRLQNAAKNSLMLAGLACLLVVPVAFLLAYGVNRAAVPFATTVRFAALVPLVSPPVIMAFAAILLFGRQGVITNDLLDHALGLIDADTDNLYGIGGVVLAQLLSFTPPAFIILDNALARQDGRLEEAAASQGAGPWAVFRRVTLPMAAPGLVRAVILVFILSMTDFGNPLVIGRDFPVVAGIVYDEMIGFSNTPLSAALCIWLILPAIVAYLVLEAAMGRKRYTSAGDTGVATELPVPRPARLGIASVTYLYLGLVSLVYLTVVVGSVTRVWGQDFSLTFDHFRETSSVYGYVASEQGLSSVWQSIRIAAMAAPLGGILALIIAYIIERVRPPGRNLLNFVVLLPAVLPGVIFGVGYLVFFNAPLGMPELALTGTSAILVANILFGNMFVGVLAGRALLQRYDASIEEAAASLGASTVERFVRVTMPMMRHAILLGALYVFIDGLTTLSAVVFLVGPEHDLASVAIFDHASNAYYGLACAKSVAILATVALVMGAMGLSERIARARGRVLAPARRPA
ncbi:MAG: iron ABC transporter permease [Rhodospirillaceae bacterium]|nr:iron ABC transporter permease [Rhodospirillaceae bacterium]